MRVVVLILLLANVALFAYLDYDAQQVRTPSAALAQQIKPERIRLMTAQEVAALSPGATVCFELGPLTLEQAGEVRKSLAAVDPAPQLSERVVDEAGGAPLVFLQVREVSDALRKRINEHMTDTEAELQWCPPEVLQAGS